MSLLADSHIAFVNLDARPDRLAGMVRTLAKIPLVAQRVRGLLPSEVKVDPSRIACMLSRPQKGAIGCHFSQVSIMQRALELNKHAFVMEDDLVICSDFLKRMEHMDKFLSTHAWDVLWLGGTFHVNPPWWHKQDLGRDCAITEDPRVVRTFGAFSTHAYIVNRDSIGKILKGLNAWLPKSMGIDWAFIQMQPSLFTYAFVPGCIKQYDNQSNIGHGITKFSGFAKLGPYWFQDKMEDFDPVAFNWHEAAIHP